MIRMIIHTPTAAAVPHEFIDNRPAIKAGGTG